MTQPFFLWAMGLCLITGQSVVDLWLHMCQEVVAGRGLLFGGWWLRQAMLA